MVEPRPDGTITLVLPEVFAPGDAGAGTTVSGDPTRPDGGTVPRGGSVPLGATTTDGVTGGTTITPGGTISAGGAARRVTT